MNAIPKSVVGVDVASGVESRPGKKDPRAMRALMREVEAANHAADLAAAKIRERRA